LESLKSIPEDNDHIEKIYRFGAKDSLEKRICTDLQSQEGDDKLGFIPIYS